MDEAESTALVVEETDAVLTSGDAGGKVIRGGALRAGGYVGRSLAATGAAGLLLSLPAAPVILLLSPGPVAVGQYVTVISLLAIAGGLTDAGFTVIGQREYTI